jgi:hypothetical protein
MKEKKYKVNGTCSKIDSVLWPAQNQNLHSGPQRSARSCVVAHSAEAEYAKWPIAKKPILHCGP